MDSLGAPTTEAKMAPRSLHSSRRHVAVVGVKLNRKLPAVSSTKVAYIMTSLKSLVRLDIPVMRYEDDGADANVSDQEPSRNSYRNIFCVIAAPRLSPT
jgi:hypothetical protein